MSEDSGVDLARVGQRLRTAFPSLRGVLLVPGAQKSGTTSLCHALAGSESVRVARAKEPDFLVRTSRAASEFDYVDQFGPNEGDPERVRWIVDGSTAYLPSEDAASRALQLGLGEVRSLIMLRDPLSRMISAFRYQQEHDPRSVAEAFPTGCGSLDELVCLEERLVREAFDAGRIKKARRRTVMPLWYYRLVRNSVYAADVQRQFDALGRERCRVVTFETLGESSGSVLRALADWLEVPTKTEIPHSNPTLSSRSGRVAGGLRSLSNVLPEALKARLRPGIGGAFRRIAYRRPNDALPPGFAEEFRQLYADEARRLLEALEGVDLLGGRPEIHRQWRQLFRD